MQKRKLNLKITRCKNETNGNVMFLFYHSLRFLGDLLYTRINHDSDH